VTILEILKKTDGYFKTKGVDSPRLTAEILLSELLKCRRLDLYLNFDKPLSTEEVDLFRGFVKRRAAREPLQYIIGKTSFMDFDVSVATGCLIPRPETAAIIESLSEHKESLAGKKILDIGTGSGIIAVAVARLAPEAKITAIDKSETALEQALKNSADLNVNNIEFILSDLFSALDGRKFDYILSNPPYIPTSEIAMLQKEVSLYEPSMALDGGADGLDFYRAIFRDAGKYLNENGMIYLEHGDGQSEAIEAIATDAGFRVHSKIKDLAGKLRVLSATFFKLLS
jgi:release factor glutamine methyltransferase